jgi:hypothetical protein
MRGIAMKMDRALQRELLEKLAESYPDKLYWAYLNDISRNDEYVPSLAYLQEHALVVNDWSEEIGGPDGILSSRITARGLDFLEDDGGLGAVLNVVTVKIHSETIRELLMERAQKNPDPTIRKLLLNKIKELPGNVLQAATIEGMKKGLEHVDLAAFLDKLLGP